MTTITLPRLLENTGSNNAESSAPDRDTDRVTLLSPGASAHLAHLSDSDLLSRTLNLVGKSNQDLAALLDHLAEVGARGLHRQKACASLYTYRIHELRFSEDAAARRSSAAKLVRRFPAILPAVASGQIHLTGLLLLGPHLTDENHVKLLSLAQFRTKREILKLIRRVAPLPPMPDRVEPLGTLSPSQPNPSWSEFVESLCPPVRKLNSLGPSAAGGERPRADVDDAERMTVVERDGSPGPHGSESPAPARGERSTDLQSDSTRADTPSLESALKSAPPGHHGNQNPAPARDESAGTPDSAAAELYLMQFTTTVEHAELVERARALLSHAAPTASLGELHVQAMRLLVEFLEKKRFGSEEGHEPCRQASKQARQDPQVPRQRGRYLPARLRRAVYERDGLRCAYVDERGVRCGETRHLEAHHLHAFALGGEHDLLNLSLRCRAHNALAAEQDFGRAHMARHGDGRRHESERLVKRSAELNQPSEPSNIRLHTARGPSA
jgi:5-methylcytosine-specific restriction endonuclease McrA